jgi:hypothetical protein
LSTLGISPETLAEAADCSVIRAAERHGFGYVSKGEWEQVAAAVFTGQSRRR